MKLILVRHGETKEDKAFSSPCLTKILYLCYEEN